MTTFVFAGGSEKVDFGEIIVDDRRVDDLVFLGEVDGDWFHGNAPKSEMDFKA
ncbi:MAG: hypothetical protein JW836_14715 [Deltaproteobacteria bacterium]|nr:hypothetical protein [Deltaproteobacteria bacterium]